MNYAGKFDAALSLDGQGSLSPASSHVDSFTAKAHGHVPDGAVVIADPNLIFHGEFKRTGLDLVLSHDGHDVVVHDYFRGDKRAAIASPDGAHLTGDIVSALTGYVQVAQAAPGAAAAQVIGHVTKLTGSATAIRNGVSVVLNNGDNVEKGDVVSTGSESTLGITFVDGTVFGLSSNARMVLNEMVYDPNGSNNSSLLSLVAGTITFVAGETAKHGDMKIDTPVATMGIRGTAVLTEINFVVPAGGGDPQPQANFQVLVEPNGTTGSYILFDKLTLLPIATVNQAGQMIQISGGNVSVTNALLSPDVQKLITDVFTLKFTDNNTNTKLTTNFTDTITQSGNVVVIKTDTGATATATFNTGNNNSTGPSQGGQDKGADRFPGPPHATSLDANGNVTSSFNIKEHAGATADRSDATGDPVGADTVTIRINFVDQNLGDRPTVSVDLADAPNYVYMDAGQHDVTGSLSALQKHDIAATQIQINVAADAGNTNNGSATLTYTLPDHAFDFLAAGETLTLTYMVRVNDNFTVNPESTFIPITITITGTNDKPTVATSGGTVIEKVGTGNTALDTISGAVTFTDVDLTDRPIVSAALSTTQPFKYLDAHGHDITSSLTPEQLAAVAAVELPLTVVQGAGNSNNGSATWTYSVPDHLFDFLADGETLVLNYVVQVDDGHGGVVNTPITVSINGADVSIEGTNDVPTIVTASTTPTGAVKEDAAATLSAGGTITFNDPDLTDTHTASFALKSTASTAHLPGFADNTSHIGTFALTAVSETPGVSTVGSVGWSFTLDDNDPVLQSLAEGQTITQVYTVTIDDHHGGTVTQDVTVVITGTNDAPTITSNAAAAAGGVTEDAATPTLSTGGTLAIQDLDLIDTHTAAAVFKSSASSAHLPGFTEGTTHIGTFTIDPVVTESNSDTDNGATLGWHFSLADSDPVLQSLAEGQTITQIYTVTFTDNHGAQVTQDVTVVITGTNDAPVITSNAAAAAGGVTEDAATPTLSTGGTLAIQDLDLIDTHTAAAVFKSSASSAHLPGFTEGTTHIGTFTIDPVVTESNSDTDNGATLGWHFSLADNDPVLQSLAEGQTITQIYTVTFTDNHGAQATQDVTVVITGTNDAPTITSNAAAAAGAVTEDTGLTLVVGGTLAIQDLDLIDTHSAAAAFKSSTSSAHLPGFSDNTPLGTFTIDPSVTELNSDTDNGATLGWHFSLDNGNAVLQSLAQGQSITEVYTVTFTDNHGAQVSQDVTVTINGANDAPTITSNAAAAAGVVTEDTGATLSIDGTLAIQDLDLIDTHTAAAVFKSSTSSAHLPGFNDNTSLGTFTIDPAVTELNSDTDNGATLGWHFSLDNGSAVLQSLAQGQSITEIYTVTFTDNHGAQVSQDVTVTINGANDAPIVTSDAAAASGGVIEDAATPTLSTGGTLAIKDVDLIDTHTATAVFKSSSVSSALSGFGTDSHIGTFTIDPSVAETSSDTDGSATLGWHFSLNDNDPVLQSLAEGQTIRQVYTVTFTDNHGAVATQDVTVTITGINDAPTLSAVEAGTLVDTAVTDTFSDLTGTLVGADPDSGETATLTYAVLDSQNSAAATVTGQYGSLTVNANGTYDYVPDAAAINALPAGSYTDTFTIQTMDVHGATGTATFTVNVTGANDTPMFAHLYASSPAGITGGNNVPTLLDVNAGTLTDTAAADSFSDLTGKLLGTDADTGETATLTYAVLDADNTATATVAGHYGTLTVNADGSYDYAPDATAINALPAGSYTDTFTVQTKDVHGATGTATLTVNVTGANDAPVITAAAGDSAGAPLTETNAGLSATGTLTVSDADTGDHVTVALDHVSIYLDGHLQADGIEGLSNADLLNYLTVQAGDILDGTTTQAHFAWNFNSGSQAFDFLAAGHTLSLQYTIVPDDGHAATGTGNGVVTINIAGANDVPTLANVTTGPLVDTAASDSFTDLTGQLVGSDVDSGETATLTYAALDSHGAAVATVTGHYGSLTVNSSGAYDYTPDATAINALPAGSYTDTFTVQTTDVHGATGTATFTVDVTGANDTPTLSNVTIGTLTDTAAADTFSNLTGKLAGADADSGETATLTYAVLNADHVATATVTGLYGALTVGADGSYSYVPNATAINALSAGHYTDNFTVQTKDVHGATATATLTVDVTGANDSPVFNVDNISVSQPNDDHIVVHGLVVTDPDAAANEIFTLQASTAAAGSSVNPSSSSGTFAAINAMLHTVTYSEGSGEPSTDKVMLTVADGHGATDTVNLIFNLSENAEGYTSLLGTTGKDVFFGTAGHDQFVFGANSNHDTIVNFTSGSDHIDLTAIVTTSNMSDWMAQHVGASPTNSADTLITIDAADTILLKGVTHLTANDILHA
ncbi:VCBS domain-containing protein [Bradyrhizobium guangdongense]